MPELPEVQTVVNSLSDAIGKKISQVTVNWKNVVYNLNSDSVNHKIKNNKIIDIYRIGKYIIIKLDDRYIAFHLRMTGYLYLSKNKPKKNKYLRCYFKFNDNTFLFFEDMRKFGGFYLLRNIKQLEDKLGIDPFESKFCYKWLIENILKKNRMIKPLLLDQSFICGIGNIYTDEILWKSKIHPTKITSDLKKNEVKALHGNILRILNKSLKYHGTTIINFKFDNMKTGGYGSYLNVYGKKGEKCKRCSHLISKLKIASRGTYVCLNCQPN